MTWTPAQQAAALADGWGVSGGKLGRRSPKFASDAAAQACVARMTRSASVRSSGFPCESDSLIVCVRNRTIVQSA